jgi:hypothetical protein
VSLIDGFLVLGRLRFVLRGALGLNFRGFENTVGVQASVGQSLGTPFKGIRQRVDSAVHNFQLFRILVKDEGDFPATPNDRTVFHVAPDAEPFAMSLVAHLAEFGNGFIVSFAFADAPHGQPDQKTDHGNDQKGKFPVGFHALSLFHQYTAK